jgi:excisionase family DNA binding protein
MKLRSTQFGERVNTASPRQHASRLAVDTYSNDASLKEENPEIPPTSMRYVPSASSSDNPMHSASRYAATGKDRGDERHLLNVHEVAELLQVPVSWVYERVRKRSLDRLPGYRLGKYWRFREADIQSWIERQRTGARSNA